MIFRKKVSFDEFQKYMKQTYPEKKFDFGKDIHDNMKEKAKNAMRAAFGKINKGVDLNQNSMIFEVFGLDFMIDEDLKVWLIEINTNPCLELSSPLLGKIISNMLENAFR